MKEEYREIGPCPKCGAPGEYHYNIEWPANEDENHVLIKVNFKCTVCGFSINNEKILIPVKALYLLKGIIVPQLRPFIERAYLASNIRLNDRS
jgi:hypothetical protein